jgi:hypothetical protein
MASTDQRFAELKQKFSPVLQFLDDHRVSLQNLQIQDDKLLIRAAVPTEDLRGQIQSVIGRIDPSFDEVLADIRVEASDNAPHTGQTTVQSDLEFSRD